MAESVITALPWDHLECHRDHEESPLDALSCDNCFRATLQFLKPHLVCFGFSAVKVMALMTPKTEGRNISGTPPTLKKTTHTHPLGEICHSWNIHTSRSFLNVVFLSLYFPEFDIETRLSIVKKDKTEGRESSAALLIDHLLPSSRLLMDIFLRSLRRWPPGENGRWGYIEWVSWANELRS